MSDTLPAWAIAAARDAIAKQDAHESLSQVVARALVAERAAERERTLDAICSLRSDYGGKGPFTIGALAALDRAASAIRNQEPER